MWIVLPGRVALAQAITIEEDYPAQHTPIIDARSTVGIWKEGLEAQMARLGQPEEVAHVTAHFFEP
jgi:hypothetical protein